MKLKVAHVTATFPPYWAGTGNVAYHNARLLHERGHEVTVFTAQTERSHELTHPFKVASLPVVLRLGNAPLTLALVSRLRGFDLIHLHYPYIFGADLALLAAKLYNIPLVLTYHNQLQETQPVKKVLFNLYNTLSEPIVLRGTKKVFAVTEGHFASLHPNLAASARVTELSNGVDTAQFKPQANKVREELGVPRERAVALFVGALDQAHRFKNVDGLLRAFANLNLDAELWIMGDGDLRSSLESLARQLELGERVRFLGKRSPSDLPPFYTAANVVVLPSTSVESFGLVLIEAMACATPVIASALPGVKSLVRDGVDGCLVPPGDLEALSKGLKQMLSNPERSQQMGQAGYQKVRHFYDWNAIGERLETLYAEVMYETRASSYAA
jgi:glycosyltransferase involved in cell wall biosynthesis